MSIECSICERDIRGPHAEDCPRYRPPAICVHCGGELEEEGQCLVCLRYGREDAPRALLSIEQLVCLLLDPVLVDVVRQRTELGVKKYGQTLDHNHQPRRARAIHLMQELLDGQQYGTWGHLPKYASRLAHMANELRAEFDLSAEEIMAGGKQ